MKQLILVLFAIIIVNTAFSQTPEQFKYQAVLRDGSGNLKAGVSSTIIIEILQGSASGDAIFAETHSATTNAQGIVNLNIGSITAGLGTIDWAADAYYIRITVDGTEMGASQLLSVPYALYAKNAGNGIQTSGTPQSGDILYNDGISWVLLSKGADGQVLKLDAGLPGWKSISVSGSTIPAAIFIVSQLSGTTTQTIQVDASGVADDIDAAAVLRVRWRWNDGDEFTEWSTVKTASNIYTSEGAKNITLEVKDSDGNIGTASRAININNSMFLPVVFTNAASDITATGAVCGGNIVSSGGIDVSMRGVCWSTSENPTIANSKTTDGTGLGIYSSSIAGLIAGTIYYIRAYATNATGTSYGNQVMIQAELNVVFPSVTTTEVTNITANAVTSGGNVTATGGGSVTARGVCWSANQNPTISDSKTTNGTGTGPFQSQIASLIPGTYYARAYATNSSGTGYGNMVSFTTEQTLPVLTTKNITDISAMGGVSGGIITSAGGGTISDRGICWSDSPNPTITNEKSASTSLASSFSAAITKAGPSTIYYLKAYATNEIGTGYGDQKTFSTSESQYYTSFETGMTPSGWAGPFTVTNESAYDGSYSFMSLTAQENSETFTTTLSTTGQISFYYSFADGSSIDFYIDDVLISNYPNDGSGWRQGLAPVNPGTHIFKWTFHKIYSWGSYYGKIFIDQIIITK
jgi:hypothetical protein